MCFLSLRKLLTHLCTWILQARWKTALLLVLLKPKATHCLSWHSGGDGGAARVAQLSPGLGCLAAAPIQTAISLSVGQGLCTGSSKINYKVFLDFTRTNQRLSLLSLPFTFA